MKQILSIIAIVATISIFTACKKSCDTPGVIYYKIVVETTGGVSATYNDNVFATPNAPAFNTVYSVINAGNYVATFKIGSNPQQTQNMSFAKPDNCKKRTYTVHLRDAAFVVDYIDENN